MLDDGSAVRGRFGSFNISVGDSPDRDVILQRPLYYRPAGASEETLYDLAAVCCPASRIVALFVQFVEPNQQVVTRLPEEGSQVTTAETPGAEPEEATI
jgi:hypothetical protein